MSLYKYITAEIAEIVLKNQEIRFTQPIAFNDPYDVYPKLSKIISDVHLEKILSSLSDDKETVDELIDKAIVQEVYKLPPATKLLMSKLPVKKMFSSYIEQHFGSFYDFMLSYLDYSGIREQVAQTLLYLLSNNLGILSLSKIYDNILMWSHYANCHRGVVIEFDENHPFLEQFENNKFSQRIEVEYSVERPEFFIERFDLNVDETMQMAKQVLFTKSKEWHYEKEYRIVRSLDKIKKLDYTDANGYEIYVKEFPKDLIKGIIWGSRMNKRDKINLSEIINNAGYNISVDQASLSSYNYKIVLDAT